MELEAIEATRAEVSPREDAAASPEPSDATWEELPRKKLRPARILQELAANPDAAFRWKGLNPNDAYISKSVRAQYLKLNDELRSKLKALRNLESKVATEELALLQKFRGDEFVEAPNDPRTLIFNSEMARQSNATWKTFVAPDGVRHRVPWGDLVNTTAAGQMVTFAEREAHLRRLDFFEKLGTLPSSNRELIEQYFLGDDDGTQLHELRLANRDQYISILLQLF